MNKKRSVVGIKIFEIMERERNYYKKRCEKLTELILEHPILKKAFNKLAKTNKEEDFY